MTDDQKRIVLTLQSAARALSSVCDGARTEDGAGFSGADVDFGKSLASKDRWSPKQIVSGQKMLRKYSKQLSGLGVSIADLPTLTLEDLMLDTPRVNKIDFNPETDAFEFWFDYDYAQKEFVKTRLKGFYRADGRGNYWNLTSARVDLETLTAYIDYYKPTLTKAASDQLVRGVEIDNTLNIAQSASTELSQAEDADLSGYDLSGFGMTPYNFQKAGALYAMLKKKVIIGDDMGLGKTIQALLAAHLSGAADKFIVVCPASVKINWQREIVRAMPQLTTSIWNGKAGDPNVNVIIINYDNLKKQLQKLLRFEPTLVIFDEIHYLKTVKSQRTQAAFELAAIAEYVFGLTGTPILNRPDELIAPLTLLGRIQEFGGPFQFATRYCGAFSRMIWIKSKKTGRPYQIKVWDTTGATNLEELNGKLRQVCMVRRKKVDVLKDLPTKQRSQVVFPIDNRKEYDSARSNLLAYVEACAAEDKAFLKQISYMEPAAKAQAIRQRQMEVVERTERAEQLVMVETMKQLATTGKMSASVDWIQDFLASGEKLVVFATHVNAQQQLCAAFPGISARILGEDSSEKRQAAVDRFKNDPDCRLMVASLKAGGTGVDGMQDVCSNVAFLELPWTPAECLQAEDRCYRIGQSSGVNCWYLLAEDTIEETIQTMLAQKQAVCDSVLDGASELKSGSIFNELIDGLVRQTKGVK